MAQHTIPAFLLLIGVAIVIGQTCPGANTVWDSCAPAPACKEYCTRDPTEICIEQCVPGCMCDTPGYKFKGADADYCVPESECPTCGTNEVYLTCGTACPDYCGKPSGEDCTTQCIEDCFCKEGYVREYNSTSAPCIPKGDCP